MKRVVGMSSRLGVVLLLSAFVSASAGRVTAQDPEPQPHKSAYGKLESLDGTTVIMRSEEGKRLAWRVLALEDGDVIATSDPGYITLP